MRRLSTLILGAALAAATGTACSGDGQEPNVSGVTPGVAFLGRTTSVTISGSDTEWTSSASVSFGAGVTVLDVAAPSATALVVEISVAADAAVGSRDVTVTDGGATVSYTGAFAIEPPLELATKGTLAQGSVLLVNLRNRDFERPFDTTTTGGGLFSAPEYTNVQVTMPAGFKADVSSVAPYSLDLLLFVDVNAPTDPVDLQVASGPVGAQEAFPFPDAFTVIARPALPITAGTTLDGDVGGAYDSALFAFTPAAGLKVARFAVEADSLDAEPGLILLPASGSFADILGYSDAHTFVTNGTDPYYLVYFDGSGTADYGFTISGTTSDATGGPETEPNDTKQAAATISSFPFAVTDATLADGDDEEWYKYVAVGADLGKSLRVVTFGADSLTDTVIAFYRSDGETEFGTPSDDSAYLDELTSPALDDTGTYYIKVFPSSYFDADHASYGILVELVD